MKAIYASMDGATPIMGGAGTTPSTHFDLDAVFEYLKTPANEQKEVKKSMAENPETVEFFFRNFTAKFLFVIIYIKLYLDLLLRHNWCCSIIGNDIFFDNLSYLVGVKCHV